MFVVLCSVAVVALVSVSALAEVQKGYHEEFGIPLYTKIKAFEERLGAKNYTHVRNRIIGGTLSGGHPFFAGLLIKIVNSPLLSVCGSSLLSVNRLVTAAHCWFDGTKQAYLFTVIFGSKFLSSGGIRIVTDQVIVHPQWNYATFHNDIAMIYLPSNVVFSATINPIAIPNAGELLDIPVGTPVLAVGFGMTSDAQQFTADILSEVTLHVIHNNECQAMFYGMNIISSMICTDGSHGKGTCKGDSGGPLLLNHNGKVVLIGIDSFISKAGCQLGRPAGFTRVTSFRDFIFQHLL